MIDVKRCKPCRTIFEESLWTYDRRCGLFLISFYLCYLAFRTLHVALDLSKPLERSSVTWVKVRGLTIKLPFLTELPRILAGFDRASCRGRHDWDRVWGNYVIRAQSGYRTH